MEYFKYASKSHEIIASVPEVPIDKEIYIDRPRIILILTVPLTKAHKPGIIH